MGSGCSIERNKWIALLRVRMEPWERYRHDHGLPCDLTADDIPDHEYGFAHTDHYRDRRDDRNVTDDVINLLLNDPDDLVRSEGHDSFILQRIIEGEYWSLVFSDNKIQDGPEYVLVTVYSDQHGSNGVTLDYFERKGLA